MAPDEHAALGDLLRTIDRYERAFGITGAIGLLFAGYCLLLLQVFKPLFGRSARRPRHKVLSS